MKVENIKQIDAPPSVVWRVTEDIERWPRWTPTVEEVTRLDDGPFEVGSTARIKQPGLSPAVWRVTALTRGESFTWQARVRGIRMIATHEIAPSGDGTRSTLRLGATGILAFLAWPLIRKSIREALETENAGLKTACELMAKSSD